MMPCAPHKKETFLRRRLERAPFTVGRKKVKTGDCWNIPNCVSLFSRKGEASLPGPCPRGRTCFLPLRDINGCHRSPCKPLPLHRIDRGSGM